MFFKISIFLIGLCIQIKAQEPCPAILNYIEEKLPLCGTLKNTDNFVYVDIDDDYIYKLLPLIKNEGFQPPPYFGSHLVGAHITVIYPQEMQKYHIETISEAGETISFQPKECQVVHPKHWNGVQEAYLVTVEAPKLDQIRQKYGLPKRRYKFHITVGIKK